VKQQLLLDTHIWIWSLLDPERLTRAVVRAIESSEADLWLSPLSIWELLVLVERGRLQLESDVGVWVPSALARVPLREAPLTREVALETRHVMLPHRDPVDRFLVATARAYDLTLVTADERLTAVRGLPVLPNR
jgi:PIN domain nuclease of toxin-antitoxin system